MTKQDLAALLSASGFAEDRDHPGTFRHRDGRWVVVDYVRDNRGTPSADVRSVTVHPPDGGYPTEYRRYFAPTLADLLRQGRI